MGSFASYNEFLNEIHNSKLLEGKISTRGWSEKDHADFNELKLKNLIATCELCDKYNIPYFLDAGTLLGLYRDKKIISGDSDNDISIMAKDITPEFLEAIKEYCISPEAKFHFFQPGTLPNFNKKEDYLRPLSLKYHTLDGEGKRLKFKDKMIWTDLFILYPHEDYHLFMLGRKYFRIPNKFLKNKKTLTHKGIKFKIPAMVEEYLEHVFGKGWVSPDPNYTSGKENKGFYVVLSKDHGTYTYNWAKQKGKVEK